MVLTPGFDDLDLTFQPADDLGIGSDHVCASRMRWGYSPTGGGQAEEPCNHSCSTQANCSSYRSHPRRPAKAALKDLS
jgi:hypothetical protein